MLQLSDLHESKEEVTKAGTACVTPVAAIGRKGRGGFSLPRPSPRPLAIQPRQACRISPQQPQSRPPPSHPVGTHAVGFSTASGQKVKVSEEALSRARGILSKVEASDSKNVSSRVSSEESPASAGIASGIVNCNTSGSNMGGFSTARGKPVAVSEMALAKARGLLAASEKESKGNSAASVQCGTPTMGFSTGRGQPVVVSEEALAKARGVLGGGGSGLRSGETTSKGFSTGQGERVVSKEALTKSRAVVATSGDLQMESTAENFTPGFSTGRGQKVVVSDQALSRARKVLADGDGARTAESEIKAPMGFSTGRGVTVTVSKAALAKVEGMLEGDRPQGQGELAPSISGFSTGRGQPVKISEAALARAKTLVPSGEKPNDANDRHLGDKGDSVDWGEDDDNDIVDMATMAEEVDQFMFQPYRCKPYDFKPPPFAYRGGPGMLQEQTTPAANFNTPYSGGRAQKREGEDYEAVLVKRRKGSEEEVSETGEKEGEEVLNLAGRRARCRSKQELLIAGKRKKKVRAMPGRLLQKRSSNPRAPLPPLLARSKSCSPMLDKVTYSNALQWRFKGCEHFSREAVEEADQVLFTEEQIITLQTNYMELIRLHWEMAFGLYSAMMTTLGWKR